MPFKYQKPETSPGLLLWQVSTLWQRKINQALKPFQLTHHHFVIMASIYWFKSQDQTPTQVQIAEMAKSDPVVISNAIKLLEKKALVKRKEATDTRAKEVFLTKKGSELIPTAIVAVESLDTRFFNSVPPVSDMIDIMNKLIEKNK